ncbi:MAG: argininosuccinate synthase [Oscillospiraceae bacterium]|nr:argininosuccinate synthase [Oscillospiraceae bacterium]
MKRPEDIKKIVLMYSGGLDTSVMLTWLKEHYPNSEVIAVAGDVGQGEELDGLEEKALATGASKVYVLDLKQEFVEDFIWATLKAGARYEREYLLGTAFARPVIAKHVAEIARREGADAICHGCTGKGNDQVRFELTFKHFCPGMHIIAPWRSWEIKSRDDAIAYAEARNIPLKIDHESNYSKDKNLWHLSHEGLDLEDPANEAPLDKPGFLELGLRPEDAPDQAAYVTIGFAQGIPVALDGEQLDGVALLERLNEIGGANGVGIDDLVENRVVGMKSRSVYENPAGRILHKAHDILESITLDRDTQHYKELIAARYAELVYYGQWYTPLREALDAFVDSTQRNVTGEVKIKLYKGNITGAGVTSPHSLWNEAFATFNEDDVYDQSDSEGFINLFGLSMKMQGLLREGQE